MVSERFIVREVIEGTRPDLQVYDSLTGRVVQGYIGDAAATREMAERLALHRNEWAAELEGPAAQVLELLRDAGGALVMYSELAAAAIPFLPGDVLAELRSRGYQLQDERVAPRWARRGQSFLQGTQLISEPAGLEGVADEQSRPGSNPGNGALEPIGEEPAEVGADGGAAGADPGGKDIPPASRDGDPAGDEPPTNPGGALSGGTG